MDFKSLVLFSRIFTAFSLRVPDKGGPYIKNIKMEFLIVHSLLSYALDLSKSERTRDIRMNALSSPPRCWVLPHGKRCLRPSTHDIRRSAHRIWETYNYIVIILGRPIISSSFDRDVRIMTGEVFPLKNVAQKLSLEQPRDMQQPSEFFLQLYSIKESKILTTSI